MNTVTVTIKDSKTNEVIFEQYNVKYGNYIKDIVSFIGDRPIAKCIISETLKNKLESIKHADIVVGDIIEDEYYNKFHICKIVSDDTISACFGDNKQICIISDSNGYRKDPSISIHGSSFTPLEYNPNRRLCVKTRDDQ